MSRPRVKTRNLPPKMVSRSYTNKHKSIWIGYYYETPRDRNGRRKLIPLGSDLTLARIKWAELENAPRPTSQSTVRGVHERYFIWAHDRSVSGLSTRTLADRHRYWNALEPVFGDVPVDTVKPEHMLLYFDARSSKVSAKKEIKFLSVLFNWARARGYMIAPNPVAGTTRQMKVKETRSIYVTDDMLALVYKHADPIIRDALDLAYLIGQRPTDVRRLRWDQIQDGDLCVEQGKTSAKVRIKIVGELAELLDRIRDRVVLGATIISDPNGQPLKEFGYFRSHFDKARTAAEKEAKEKGVPFLRFQFRDLRAKAASDLDSMTQARKLLGHTTENMTRNYVRARIGETVMPVLGKSFCLKSPSPEQAPDDNPLNNLEAGVGIEPAYTALQAAA